MDDMSKFKAEFLSEARDHIDSLNESLLALEKEPDNEEVINRLFRSFHTLKGNSAAMGYQKYSEFAHRLEGLLDKIRNKQVSVTREIMDILFEGCDALEKGIDTIESANTDGIDTGDIEDRLALISAPARYAETITIGEFAVLDKEEESLAGKARGEGRQIFRIIAIFDKNSPLKAAKAMLLIRNLAEKASLLGIKPSKEEISGGSLGSELEIIAACRDKSDLDIKVSGISQYEILGLGEPYKRNTQSEIIAKESEKHAIVDKHNADLKSQIRSIKIDVSRLDKLMNLVGELLIAKMRLGQISRGFASDEIHREMLQLDRLTADIENEVMQIRMVPIGNIFTRFPRMVRDLAEKEGKQVNLVIEGEDIEFDRTILDELGEPLVHLLRNSVDHGIELPQDRQNRHKDTMGNIKLMAQRDRNNAIITITDDGQGIDPEAVCQAALRKGKASEEEVSKMTPEEKMMLVFRPGVSTNQVVTEVSGRGVGMDTVQTKVRAMGGAVKLESEIGIGTTITLKLPLTVSIVTCLLTKVEDLVCALPLTNVNRTVRLSREEIKTIKGNSVFNYMGQEIALLDMRCLLGKGSAGADGRLSIVVVERGHEQIGLVVNTIIAQEQILIKKMDKYVKGVRGIAGYTILGDGTVGLVIDVNTLF